MNTPAILRKIPYSLRIALLVVIAAKILVFLVGYAAAYTHEASASPLTIIMDQFNRWDAPHYIDIARNWYVNQGDQQNFIVFFPLYPILIRLFTSNFSYVNLSALAVANVSSIFAFVYLFKLAKLDFDDGVAQKAVLFLSVFPTAYFLSAPYTEGLFFALIIASIYYARLSKWPLAGVLGLFAAVTRMAGLLLLPVLLVEYLHQKEWKPRKIGSEVLWVSLALVGFLIYLNINNQVTGNPFAFMEIERTHWFNHLDPITGLAQALAATGKPYPDNITIGAAPIIFAFLGFLAVAGGFARRLRPSYLVYMLFTWILAVSTAWWISVPRYVMAMFPMFILLGTLSRRRTVTILITVAFAAALCFFTVLFALGKWAF